MDIVSSQTARMIVVGAVAIAAAGATGAAFAGWLDHGADIFLAYTASGLAWCF